MQIKWTRDEVILAVACALQNPVASLNEDSPPVRELSEVLRTLPIVPLEDRDASFRGPRGLQGQYALLRLSIAKGEKYKHIGNDFIGVYQENCNNPAHILAVADAITACRELYAELPFGSKEEQLDFPEGALLGHLHRYCEQRDGSSANASVACEICGMTATAYPVAQPIMLIEPHLLAAPETMRPGDRYAKNQFIYVCPNCHKVLHQLRPWHGDKESCKGLLRQ